MNLGETWILGATGRVGRALSSALVERGSSGLVLVGRSEGRLRDLAEKLGAGVRALPLDGIGAMIDAVEQARPRLVVNLLGSYSTTGVEIARASMAGGDYVDLANDLESLRANLGLHDEAKEAGATLISGAGFGVLGTEAVVRLLCDGMPSPTSVRVDALASFASEAGVTGEGFAQTSVDVVTTGGRAFRDGRLVPVRLASNVQRISLPDGTTVTSASVPSGELIAAQRVSGAANVDFTSALAPTSTAVRAMLPLMTFLLRSSRVRSVMVRQLSRSRTKASARPRPYSWGHAVVSWPNGRRREGWLRAGDAMDFTTDALVAVTAALGSGNAPKGSYTPAAAFGAQIAVDAGATFITTDPEGEENL